MRVDKERERRREGRERRVEKVGDGGSIVEGREGSEVTS